MTEAEEAQLRQAINDLKTGLGMPKAPKAFIQVMAWQALQKLSDLLNERK